MYNLPLAITGVDWPGKSATQSASLTMTRSGRFFSSEAPFCCGPRQLSQPWTSAALAPQGRTKQVMASNEITRAVVLFMNSQIFNSPFPIAINITYTYHLNYQLKIWLRSDALPVRNRRLIRPNAAASLY